jgi:hydroxypyruvate isomerase
MSLTRREALVAGGAAFAALRAEARARAQEGGKVVKSGKLKQSLARWCYAKIPLDDLCKAAAGMGLPAIDLLQPEEWATAQKYGLTVSMGYAGAGTLTDGLGERKNHDGIEQGFMKNIPLAKKAAIPNVIVFFGNRRGMSDAEGMQNCVDGLNRVKKIAEDNDVTICVELLNSKVNHKDYLGDKTPFGVEVMKAVNSPRVKLLYDIYHMQIMEGDVIRTMRDNKDFFAHYHTGGVPGRHELDETQELQWRAISKAIVDMGFGGYYAHEFIPTRDPLTSLREAVILCDV